MRLARNSRWGRAGGVASAIALVLGAANLANKHAEAEPAAYQISVDVDLVVLPVTVRDRKGGNVSDLDESNFRVYEDGVLQSVRLFRHEDIPVIAGLLVDHSGSMKPKMREVIAGARAFVGSSNPQDRMFVVNFNENVSLGLPQAIDFTADPDELERAIWRDPAVGQTALYDAIVKALVKVQTGGLNKKVLVVISDGADNASAHSLAKVLDMAEHSSAIIYTVGLFGPNDPDANPKVLRRLARETGGEAFFPERPGAVIQLCEQIARDIRNQYTIGYVSTNTQGDGGRRVIRVIAQAPGHGKLLVRTRSGYIRGARAEGSVDESER